MTLAAQLLINGAALGAAYALVALGFVLVLNATRAVNFAQGDIVIAGGYAAVAASLALPVSGSAVPGLLVLPLVVAGMAIFGLVFSAVAYFPLRNRPPVAIFISTIAVGVILTHTANGLFGAAEQQAPPIIAGAPLHLAGLVVGRQSLAILLLAAVLIVGTDLVLHRTQTGRRLRAAAEDPEIAGAIGIPVAAMIAVTFALSAALAGVAGLLLGNAYFVTPTGGANLMLKAYIAVTIGGWGRVRGAVAGAFLIALFEVAAGTLMSTTVAEALLYGMLLLILVFRPQGLFGEAAGRRV